MAQVNDVAQKLYDDLGAIGAMRQQKLAYFIQAWSLAWTGRPLFHERIEAWPNGPVVQPLWRDNRYHRVSTTRIMGADVSRLDDDDVRIIDAVVSHYGRLSTDSLRALSHDEPWLLARDGLGSAVACNREVEAKFVARYYARQAVLNPEVPVKPALGPPDEASGPLVRAEAGRQMAKWSGALDRLAAV